MNSKIWYFSAIGLAMMSGCAGPLDKHWDNPVYRSVLAGDADHEPETTPAVELDALESLTLPDAIRIAIHNSPQLRAAGHRVEAASGRVLQAGLYPNPSINFEAEALGSDPGSGGETAYVVEQEIVLGGKLARARDVAESDRIAARARFVAQEFAVATRVTDAYFAAAGAQQRLSNREELATLSAQLLEAVTARVQAGSTPEPDRLRAEVVFEQAQIELDTARFEATAAQQALASAIGADRPIDLPLGSPIEQRPTLPTHQELIEATLESNARVTLARIAVERARRSHGLAKSLAVPDLVASVGPRYSDIDNESTVDAGLSLEIPLFDRNQGEVRATLAERYSASAQLHAVRLDLLAELSNTWAAFQAASAAADRYQSQLLPKAEQTLDLTRQAYQSGKTDFLRLLDAQQVVIQSRIAYVNTLQQLHSAAALLNEFSQSNTPWRDPDTQDQPHTEGLR